MAQATEIQEKHAPGIFWKVGFGLQPDPLPKPWLKQMLGQGQRCTTSAKVMLDVVHTERPLCAGLYQVLC